MRAKIREEIDVQVAASAAARTSRDALCSYVREHTLADGGLNLAQYISLGLYLSQPPELTPTVDQTDYPDAESDEPQSAAVEPKRKQEEQ